MQQKYRRRIAAVLCLTIVAALVLIATPKAAYAETIEENASDMYIPPSWINVDTSTFDITGSIFSFHPVSSEDGVTLAVIYQNAACEGFFATSRNLRDWVVRAPAAYRYYYYNRAYYWYAGGLFRTRNWQNHWQMCTAGSGINGDVRELSFIDLPQAGIRRIERFPYPINDSILWISYITHENPNGTIQREQMRIHAGGQRQTPRTPGTATALIGLDNVPWAREAIEFVVARDLMNLNICNQTGEPIVFNPLGSATRGDVLAAAIKALELRLPGGMYGHHHIPFDDVPPYGRGVYIDIARQLGLVTGIGDNLFAPDRTISRQDMMTMLYNIMFAQGLIEPDIHLTALGRFNDLAQIADYARLPISSLARVGIIAGDGISLNPGGYMTRVEAAMFVFNLYRML